MLALITATHNSVETLSAALDSTRCVHGRVKLFFVDGGSSDGTMDVIQSYMSERSNAVLLSQNDRGLYKALNQGVNAAMVDSHVTHIGVLHSDDHLIAHAFESYLSVIDTEPFPVFYSDIEFHAASRSRVRVWESSTFSRFRLHTGWMPPHTSIIVAKEVYRECGLYNPDFGTAADYEWVVRVFSQLGEESRYFPERTLSMLIGGASGSSLKARLRANVMDGRVWAHKSRLQSMLVRVCKPVRKIGQFKLI